MYLCSVAACYIDSFEAMAGERDVVFFWIVSPVPECSNLMTVFTLSCSPSPSSLPQSPSSGPLTVTGLSPDTSYSCSLVAGGRFGPQPSANITFTTHEDCESNTTLACSFKLVQILSSKFVLLVLWPVQK